MRWLLLATACLFGCYTNIARVTQRLNTKATGHEAIFVSVANNSGVSGISPEGLLRKRLREKGYQVANEAEGADMQLEVSINDAQWTLASEMPGASGSSSSSGGGSVGIGGGFRAGSGKEAIAAVVLIGVVLVVAAAVSAGEPKEWLTGTVLLKLSRKNDPVPETGAIDLRFSCVSDRPGTLRSAESELVDRVLEMF